MIVGRAHAKAILIGEHSVVYGFKAIAIPIYELYTTCTLKKSNENKLISTPYTGNLHNAPDPFSQVNMLIEALQKEYGGGHFEHIIKSNIPIGAGLGSSAALATAIVRAYQTQLGFVLSDKCLFDWVQYFERMMHVNPSGIDALTVIHDTPWVFSKTDRHPLPMKLDACLIIADTLERTPTKESVRHVATLKNETFFKPAMESLGEISEKAILAIESGETKVLGAQMNAFMEGLLNFDLSTDAIDNAIKTALRFGALGAKLTGGGMGGSIIALSEGFEHAKKIESALKRKYDLRTWITKL